MRSEYFEKTSLNTKYGQFQYLVMPKGLFNTPATFQPIMNRIFYECIDIFMVFYMDYLLVLSKMEAEHIENIKKLLSRLKDQKLLVSPKKWELMKYEMGS